MLGKCALNQKGVLLPDEAAKLRAIVDAATCTQLIAATVISIPCLKAAVMNQLCLDIGHRPGMLRNRVHGNVSVLMRKDRKDLEKINPEMIVKEMTTFFPELCAMLVHVLVPQKDLQAPGVLQKHLPRLAMVYAILMQGRNHELSALQRVTSLFLMDSVVDQKVAKP